MNEEGLAYWGLLRQKYMSTRPTHVNADLYRVYLKCLDKLQGRVPHTKTRKEFISTYVRKQVVFELSPPPSPHIRPNSTQWILICGDI